MCQAVFDGLKVQIPCERTEHHPPYPVDLYEFLSLFVVESGEAAGGEEVTWSADRQSAYVWCFETGADEEQKKEIALADAHAIASRLGLERWSAYKHPWL